MKEDNKTRLIELLDKVLQNYNTKIKNLIKQRNLLIVELLKTGFPAERISKILGINTERIYTAWSKFTRSSYHDYMRKTFPKYRYKTK